MERVFEPAPRRRERIEVAVGADLKNYRRKQVFDYVVELPPLSGRFDMYLFLWCAQHCKAQWSYLGNYRGRSPFQPTFSFSHPTDAVFFKLRFF